MAGRVLESGLVEVEAYATNLYTFVRIVPVRISIAASWACSFFLHSRTKFDDNVCRTLHRVVIVVSQKPSRQTPHICIPLPLNKMECEKPANTRLAELGTPLISKPHSYAYPHRHSKADLIKRSSHPHIHSCPRRVFEILVASTQ